MWILGSDIPDSLSAMPAEVSRFLDSLGDDICTAINSLSSFGVPDTSWHSSLSIIKVHHTNNNERNVAVSSLEQRLPSMVGGSTMRLREDPVLNSASFIDVLTTYYKATTLTIYDRSFSYPVPGNTLILHFEEMINDSSYNVYSSSEEDVREFLSSHAPAQNIEEPKVAEEVVNSSLVELI